MPACRPMRRSNVRQTMLPAQILGFAGQVVRGRKSRDELRDAIASNLPGWRVRAAEDPRFAASLRRLAPALARLWGAGVPLPDDLMKLLE